ncbi:MAG: hypothetical protein AAF481_01185 [Acidobacteriota bacterium]
MNPVIRQLASKELYVHRWTVGSGALAGVLSLFVAAHGRIGFNIGILAWLTAVVAAGAILVMHGVFTERKENGLLFVLGLPIDPAGYVRSKLVGLGLAFLLCWAPTTGAVIALVLIDPDISDGLLPLAVLLSVYLLTNFVILLSWVLAARSEALATAGVIITNMSVSVFIFTVFAIPGIGEGFETPHPDWSPAFWAVLGAELAVAALAILSLLLLAARRRDLV